MKQFLKFFKTVVLILVTQLMHGTSFAQRNLACPKLKKEKKYYEQPELVDYLHINIYGAYPIAYKTIDASASSDIKSVTRVGYAFNLQNHFVINNKIEWITEGIIAVYEKGIRLNSGSSNSHFYSSQAQFRFSTGISYNLTSKINLSLMPSLIYNTHYGYTIGTSGSGNGQGFSGDMYTIDNNVWMLGANFYARMNITKRFYFNFMSLIDFAPSSAMKADATIVGNNGAIQQESFDRKSYLLHLGLGVGYRIVQIRKK